MSPVFDHTKPVFPEWVVVWDCLTMLWEAPQGNSPCIP